MTHGTLVRTFGALALSGLAVGFAAQATTARQDDTSRKEWLQLFNGRDLNDWVIKFAHHDLGENVNDTFRVEDGLLKVRYDKWTAFDREFGHIFYKQPFSYYLLAAEYRFVGEQVAGAGPSLAWAQAQQRVDAPFARSEDDAEGSGLSDLDRGPAARRAERRQAAVDGESVHARDEHRDERAASHAALHEFHIENLRRRSMGARRGPRARRRAGPPHD